MRLPKSHADLLVRDLPDEILIYDLRNDKSYCLNSTAGIVFNACDGKTTLEDLKKQTNLPEDIIRLSLDDLKKQNLIEADGVSSFTGISRREAIRRAGLASMIALPVISALIAPHPAHAASGTCQTNVCLVTGANTCAGCTGRTITYTIYASNNASCTNPLASTSVTCTGNNPQISNTDRIRTSAV